MGMKVTQPTWPHQVRPLIEAGGTQAKLRLPLDQLQGYLAHKKGWWEDHGDEGDNVHDHEERRQRIHRPR